MNFLYVFITSISIIALLTIAIVRYTKHKDTKSFIIQICLIIFCVLILNLFFGFPKITSPTIEKRSPETDDIYFVIILYIFMLLGMYAQYIFTRFEQPKEKRTKFDFGIFIAPIFSSPITFIPLLAAFQSANIDLRNSTMAKMTIFFVAFQNGFLWKEYFDNKRKKYIE